MPVHICTLACWCAYVHGHFCAYSVLGMCLYACEPELLLPQGPWPAPTSGSTFYKQHEVLGRLNLEAGRSRLWAWCRWVGAHGAAGSRGGHEPGEWGGEQCLGW